MSDLISRQAALDALWKALYEYEDKTEKQFQESDELDVGDWIVHRIFVQNMSDIDRQVILNLPSAQPERCEDCVNFSKTRLLIPQTERKKGKWIPVTNGRGGYCCELCNRYAPSYRSGEEHLSSFCPNCGAEMRGEANE